MNIGSIITCKDGSKFEIVKDLKSGGQGSVYIVKSCISPNDLYAFKIIKEKNEQKKQRKIENIRQLKDDSLRLNKSLEGKDFNVALPITLYSNNGDFGYVMNLYTGKDIGDLMMEKVFDSMDLDKRMNLVHKIAESALWLRNSGYCYQDFSHGNFLYDEKNNIVSIIDCDNVTGSSSASSGKTFLAKGTLFYTSPEIAFGQCNPSIESDNFALATLFFKIMTGSTNSPYHGKELYSRPVRPGNMIDAAFYTNDDPSYGSDWLTFVFDKENKVNEIDLNAPNKDFVNEGKKIIKNWDKVPNEMKELFYKAFKNPLDAESRKLRPSSKDWVNVTSNKNIASNNPNITEKCIMFSNPTKPEAPVVSAPVNMQTITIRTPEGKVVEVKDEFEVRTSNGFNFGKIRKQDDNFIFTSHTMYKLKSKLGNTYNDHFLGNEMVLQEGLEIYFVMNYNEKLRVLKISK